MTMGDRIKRTAQDALGKAKEATGKVTSDEDLDANGQTDQAGATAKRPADNGVGAARDVFDR